MRPGGAIDVPKLMAAWQAFWREDGHLAAEGFVYREAGPHLMLMAFLQRIVNGGGRVEREYGLGRGALDPMICWQGEHHAIEVKIRRDTETEAKALDQVARYLDRSGLGEGGGGFLMFDLRKEVAWTDQLFVREVEHQGKKIHLVACCRSRRVHRRRIEKIERLRGARRCTSAGPCTLLVEDGTWTPNRAHRRSFRAQGARATRSH